MSINTDSFITTAIATISAVASFHEISSRSQLAAISTAVEIDEKLEKKNDRR